MTPSEKMGSFPLVSIITPSLNQAKYLEETILSVLAQDYPHVEHIIIDGGSSDGSLDVLKKYSARITWLSESDRGQSHAVNKGIRMARGSIIGWLNSDDVYAEGAVSKAVRHFLSHPDLGMVYGDAELINEKGQSRGFYKTEGFALDRLARHCFICQPASFVRSHVFADVGFLDELLHYCMDLDLWIRIAQKYEVGYLRVCLAKSRWHPACKSVARREDALREIIEVIGRHYERVPMARIKAYSHYRSALLLGWKIPPKSILFKSVKGTLTFHYLLKYYSSIWRLRYPSNGPVSRLSVCSRFPMALGKRISDKE